MLAEGRPLEAYPNAYAELLFYAFVSLVERSVEMIHALIKRVGRTATHITPPYACACVREGSHLQLLDSNRAFQEECVRLWRLPRLLDHVLAQRFGADQLRRMSNLEKVRAVYQCDMASEFQETAEARGFHDACEQVVHPAVAPLPETWRQCIAFLKVLCEGGLFSLPAALFTDWCGYDGSPIAEGTILIDPVQQCLNALYNDFFEAPLNELRVFRVINATPETRGQMYLSHVQRSRSCIIVAPCVVVAARHTEGSQLLVKESTDQLKLDIVFLVPHMDRCMVQLQRWEVCAVRATVTPKPHATMPICDGAQYMLPPDVGAPCADARAVAAASCSTVALPRERDLSVGAVRALSQLVDFGGYSNPVSTSRLPAAVDAVVQELENGNLVSVSTTGEAGERCITLRSGTVALDALLLITSPVQALRGLSDKHILSLPKLYHLVRLSELGWAPSATIRGQFVRGGVLEYASAYGRPISYFAALSVCDTIFAKGVTGINHFGSDAYYRCLISLPGAKLLAALGNGDTSQEAFATALRSEKLAIDDTCVGGDTEASAEVCVAQPQQTRANVSLLIPPAPLDDGWWRHQVSLQTGGTQFKVYIDNFVHESGRRRGWSDCKCHGCIKYEFTDKYNNVKELCGAFLCWHLYADTKEMTKADHLAWWPSPADIDAILPVMKMERF